MLHRIPADAVKLEGTKAIISVNPSGVDQGGRTSVKNETFEKLLRDMSETHERKNHDYASPETGDFYSNFEYAAQVAAPFEGVHKVFATLLGVKLARLSQLLSGKAALNEPIDDSFRDESTYSAIWWAYFRDHRPPAAPIEMMEDESQHDGPMPLPSEYSGRDFDV